MNNSLKTIVKRKPSDKQVLISNETLNILVDRIHIKNSIVDAVILVFKYTMQYDIFNYKISCKINGESHIMDGSVDRSYLMKLDMETGGNGFIKIAYDQFIELMGMEFAKLVKDQQDIIKDRFNFKPY